MSMLGPSICEYRHFSLISVCTGLLVVRMARTVHIFFRIFSGKEINEDFVLLLRYISD